MKHYFFSKKFNFYNKNFIILTGFLLLMNWSVVIKAQKTNIFVSNDKNVNIDSLNKQVSYIMNEIGIPSLSLAIIEDNQIVYSNNYGYKQLSKKNKVNNRTIYEACSLSKSFLVFIAHQLVNEGILNLDKPMYQYKENDELKHDSRYKLITSRMVLGHCSGIENWKRYNNPELLEIVSTPGEKFVYSGEGYDYLAIVIEEILNQSYEEYFKNRISKPLKLESTYIKFNKRSINPFFKGSPTNYTVGHNNFGLEYEKWKNTYPVPGGGISTTAKDYAKLIVSTFNKQYLSENSINDIIEPIVGDKEINPTFYLGAGFAVYNTLNDTIIFQGGSNGGFKANVFYSIVNKRGFVFFTNSDRGKLISATLSKMTAGLEINEILGKGYFEQYPSKAIKLLKIYEEKDSVAMFAEIEKLIAEGTMGVNTLNELGDLFLYHDKSISKEILERNIKLYPESSVAYCLLGELNLKLQKFDLAYLNFTKAKELEFDMWAIDHKITQCKKELDK